VPHAAADQTAAYADPRLASTVGACPLIGPANGVSRRPLAASRMVRSQGRL